MRKFITIFLLITFLPSLGNFLFAQDFRLSLDSSVGNYEFSTAKGDSYLKKAADVEFQKVLAGIKIAYGLNDLKLSFRVSQFSQKMAWDSINVYPLSDSKVWSTVSMDFRRIQFYSGIGYHIKIKKLFLEPEIAVMFSKATKFEVTEMINNGPFSSFEPAEYSIKFNEYGARFSMEVGYYLTEKVTLGIRPAYYYGELETSFDRPSGNQLEGRTENYTKGFALGIDLGYIL